MSLVTIGPLSIDAPQGWTLATVILAGPPDSQSLESTLLWTKPPKPFQRNLVATVEQVDGDETPETYVNRQIEGLRTAGFPRQEVREPQTVTLESGHTGLLTEGYCKRPGD